MMMRKVLVAFLLVGFFFGFAATSYKKRKIVLKPAAVTNTKKVSKQKRAIVDDNFDFLYGQWELLNAQGIASRKPSSLEDAALNIVLEDDIYVDSVAAKANNQCDSGVEFEKYPIGKHRNFIKEARKLPLLRNYFGDGKRDGIWTGQVLCKKTHKPLWSAVLLTRRQLFLVSNTHVAELYRRDSVAPIRETFTDTDAEVSTE